MPGLNARSSRLSPKDNLIPSEGNTQLCSAVTASHCPGPEVGAVSVALATANRGHGSQLKVKDQVVYISKCTISDTGVALLLIRLTLILALCP